MEDGKVTITITKDECRRFGFHFGMGIFNALGLILIVGWIVCKLLNPLFPTDDCDRDAEHRCGMEVVTDAKTGRQYLVSPHGGIIERAPTTR